MRLLVFLFCTFLFSSVFGQDPEAEIIDSIADYKVGDFYVLLGSDTCFVSRTENRQKESCTNSEDEYQFIVIWLKDRKYILRDIHYNPSTKPKVMRQDVVMTIMEVGTDYHVVHARKKGMPASTMKVYNYKQNED